MALLLIDIGNTRVHLALADDAGINFRRARPHPSDEAGWLSLFADLPELPNGAALVSVRPALNVSVQHALARCGVRDVKFFGRDLALAIPNLATVPASVGADRLMNASAAAYLYPGEAVIVVSLGTALTHDLVDRDGAFRGGMIAPGLRTQLRSLHQAAALLPEVELQECPSPLGGETAGAIAAGVYWGLVGAIERSCVALRATLRAIENDQSLPLRIIATGGDAELVAASCPTIESIVPDLALLGLWRTALAARR